MKSTPAHQEVAGDLAAMAEADQAFRMGWFERRDDPAWWQSMSEMDARHMNRLKEIVVEIGWPTIDKVGGAASHAAWLLVQHFVTDIPFQKKCLKLMEQAGPGTIDRRQIAYLADKIAVSEDRPQRFGTQYQSSSSNLLPPFPLEDPGNVDALRAEYGLEPMKPFYDVAAAEQEEKNGLNFSSLTGYKKKPYKKS